MMTATILNAVLALGVIVMIITPLVWAILTQHRDHRRAAAIDPHPRLLRSNPRRRASERSYQPIAGRA